MGRILELSERLDLISWSAGYNPEDAIDILVPVSKSLALAAEKPLRNYWSLARTSRNGKVPEEVRLSALESLFKIRVKIESWLAGLVNNGLLQNQISVVDLLDGTVFGASLKQGVSFRLPLTTCKPTPQCEGWCYAHDGLDASISTVVRGVLNGCFAKAYEDAPVIDRPAIMSHIIPHVRKALRQAIKERDRSGLKRKARVRLSHLGEIVEFPCFANDLAKLINEISNGEVVCAVYTRHEKANVLDRNFILVNFTLDETSLNRRAWVPPGAKTVYSAWGGRVRKDVDINFLEHHHLEHTPPVGLGHVCPATRPEAKDKTCDGVRCYFCFSEVRRGE